MKIVIIIITNVKLPLVLLAVEVGELREFGRVPTTTRPLLQQNNLQPQWSSILLVVEVEVVGEVKRRFCVFYSFFFFSTHNEEKTKKITDAGNKTTLK
jgi:hypothetical protein